MIWLKEDFDINSNKLVIAFGSHHVGSLIENKFEWGNMLNDISSIMNFKKLIIRDLNCSWWQTSFEEMSEYGPHILANFLTKKIRESGAKKVLAIGASMGGYGSILFGCLCKLDLVISISAQTYFSKSCYRKYKLNKKFKGFYINKKETDLKIILDRYENNHTNFHIYFGENNKEDLNYSNRISNCAGVTLFPVKSARHDLVKEMKTSGMLKTIILDFICEKDI